MYRLQRNRPSPASNAARLAAEAAFAPAPAIESPTEKVSNALVTVKKKRALIGAGADEAQSPQTPHDDTHVPRVFRVPMGPLSELDHKPSDEVASSNSVAEGEPERPVHRRTRRSAVVKPGPVVTIVAAPARPTIDLAALALELEAAANARAHAAAQAQLSQLQAQLNALDPVLTLIAKARAFTLTDTQLSAQWQQLTQAARHLAESIAPPRLNPQG